MCDALSLWERGRECTVHCVVLQSCRLRSDAMELH